MLLNISNIVKQQYLITKQQLKIGEQGVNIVSTLTYFLMKISLTSFFLSISSLKFILQRS